MRWQDIVTMARLWPEVDESISYGEPSLKVRKRLLARLRIADESLVLLGIPFEERDLLIEMSPDTFFAEPHYKDHEIVLARIDKISRLHAARILERRWRSSATKRAVEAFDAAKGKSTR